MTAIVPPPVGPDWRVWGRQLSTFLARNLSRLQFLSGGEIPSENGVLLWDDVNGYPVVSRGNAFREVVLAGHDAHLLAASDITAASSNTAYAITFSLDHANGISLGTPASRVVFSEGGQYKVDLSFQIESSSGSRVDFWFWHRVNGVDADDMAMRNTLHDNGATLVVSHTIVIDVDDDDYLEAMWATSNTNGSLSAHAAETFAPACPAATMTITRVHG